MIDKKRVILSSVILLIVSSVYTFITCGWLFKGVYDIEPVIWLDSAIMMGTTNMILSTLITFITLILLSAVYGILHEALPGKTYKRGLIFGFLIFLIGPLTGIIAMPFYMTISWMVILYWVVSLLIKYLIIGSLLGKIYEEGITFKMNLQKQTTNVQKEATEAVRKLAWYDMSLVKLSVMAFTLMLVKFIPALTSLKWWVYLIIAVVAAAKPLYTAYIKK
jgi:hypothetical protein